MTRINEIERFHDNVAQRVTVIGLTSEIAGEICGATRQSWHKMRVSKDPRLSTIRRIALLLAIPDDLLFTATPDEIVRYPVPTWDHLSVLEREGEAIGMQGKGPGMQGKSDTLPPKWGAFVAMFGPKGGV